MTEKEKLELIDAFLLNRLNEAEKEEFNKLLNDESFSSLLKEQQLLMKSISLIEERRLKKQFLKWDKDIDNSFSFRRTFKKYRYLAASIILLIAASAFILLLKPWEANSPIISDSDTTTTRKPVDTIQEQDTSTLHQPKIIQPPSGKMILAENLFEKHFCPYPNELTEKSRGMEVPEDSLERAMYYYDEKEYDKAAAIFRTLSHINKSKKNVEVIKLYHGISELLLSNINAAREIFSQLKKSSEPKIRDAALWYDALRLLKEKKSSLAKKLLQQLVSVYGNYQEKARSLLEEMEKI